MITVSKIGVVGDGVVVVEVLVLFAGVVYLEFLHGVHTFFLSL